MALLLSKEIFENPKNADLVLFFDQKPDNGRDLLTAYVFRRMSLAPSNTFLHVLCFEKKPSFWKNRFRKLPNSDRIEFYDFWYDSLGWNDANRLCDASDISSKLRAKIESSNSVASSCDRHLVIFDSTSLLLLTLSPNELSLLLVDIPVQLSEASGRDLQTTVAVLHHSDIFDSYSERALRAISTSNLHVTSSSHNQRSEHEFVCVVNHQSRRDTAFNKLEKVVIGGNWSVQYDVAAVARIMDHSYLKTENDPTANMSFNLNLTDEERYARNNVTLPHSRGSGVIYYEPDEADDIDYEDPDE